MVLGCSTSLPVHGKHATAQSCPSPKACCVACCSMLTGSACSDEVQSCSLWLFRLRNVVPRHQCCLQVASWGGYSFIINLLPIHCLASIFTGRLTAKLYIAYAPLIVLGTLEAGELGASP